MLYHVIRQLLSVTNLFLLLLAYDTVPIEHNYVLCCAWYMCSAVRGICALLCVVYVLCCAWYMCSAVRGICALLCVVYVLCCAWYMCSAVRGICALLCVVCKRNKEKRCSVLLLDSPECHLIHLQKIHNRAARQVTLIPTSAHMTHQYCTVDLHWLPIRERNKLKITDMHL